MAISQPQATDKLNNPNHALSHCVFANDDSAPAQSIVVDANGLVGIGTTASGSKLEVYTNGALNYITNHSDGTDASLQGIVFVGGNYNRALIKSVNETTNAGSLQLQTYDNGFASVGIKIDKSGNVGIGTTGPNASLHVAGNVRINYANWLQFHQTADPGKLMIGASSATGGMRIVGASNGPVELGYYTGDLDFNAWNPVLYAGASGNVGIGTTASRANLEVVGVNAVPTALTSVISAGTLILSDGGNVGTVIGNYADTGGEFYATYIQSRSLVAANIPFNILLNPLGGNVGIGTSSPNANAILDVSSTTKAFMPPRMTTTERDAIGTPTEGMMIYNLTTHLLNFYNGTVWGAV
jgi:hypothetical protein